MKVIKYLKLKATHWVGYPHYELNAIEFMGLLSNVEQPAEV